MKPFLGFWEKLEKPFFVMAPLANVTDAAFRRFLIRYSRPDVLWTEFVAADGLCHPKGRQALLRDLLYTEAERPIVAQLFTGYPEKMEEAAELVANLGFDGVDINMGCPDKNVMKQGAGASCMKDPKRARDIILAAQRGVKKSGKAIPVSVKTRLGFNEDALEELLPVLLEARPAAVTLHARTKKEMSLVPAHWDRVRRAVEIASGSGTLIIGNGDVVDMADAHKKVVETGADGIMLGRAMFGNPWIFDATKKEITIRERLEATLDLTKTFDTVWGGTKNFALLKKHYQAYIRDFPEAKEWRIKLMASTNAREACAELEGFLKTYTYRV